jgi:hypothetical protein
MAMAEQDWMWDMGCIRGLTKSVRVLHFLLFGWQYVSSAGFPTPTSLASAARTFSPLA